MENLVHKNPQHKFLQLRYQCFSIIYGCLDQLCEIVLDPSTELSVNIAVEIYKQQQLCFEIKSVACLCHSLLALAHESLTLAQQGVNLVQNDRNDVRVIFMMRNLRRFDHILFKFAFWRLICKDKYFNPNQF